jgi:hypothetical protein
MSKCIFCGEEINEFGICPNSTQHFKIMCLNCLYCVQDNNNYICTNEKNKNDAIEKIKTSYNGGYEIEEISLKPLPLKAPTKSCQQYELDFNKIAEFYKNKLK